MYSQYKVAGYNITTDPEFRDGSFINNEELTRQLDELFIECQNKNNKKIIYRLSTLIEKYPNLAQLKNFLSVAYHTQGNYIKAMEVNNSILAEHPDYLFAKINLAHKYINTGMAEKVPDILGEAMEIKELYPHSDLFHLTEITAFYHVVIRYYAAIKNWERAEKLFEVLKEIAPIHSDTKTAEGYLFSGRMENKFKLWQEWQASLIKVKSLKPVSASKKTTAPVFNHIEINNLYNHGLAIPHEIIKEIIALPWDTVIKDLEEVIFDAIDRYPYFKKAGWEEDTHNFPLHAFYLLAELKAESSLKVMLNFLKNNNEVIAFWFGEHLNSTLWQPVYLLSQNNLAALHQFLLEPGIDTFSKTLILEALIQTVLHSPEKRDELFSIYKNVFIYLNKATLDDNVIDSDFIGLMVSNMIDAGFKEMLPLIKKLYDKGYVSLIINGTYDEAESYFNEPTGEEVKREIENIFDFYSNRLNEQIDYAEEEEDFFDDDEIQASAIPAKIGRNDPCPCGSGKKYKKCCLSKLPL